MKTANAVLKSPVYGRRFKDDLFAVSIRKIVSDIMLQEIKGSGELKTIAIISPFRNDGKSELSEQIAQAFAEQGSKTLLLCLQSIHYMGTYAIDPLKSGRLLEECISRKDKKGFDCLSLAEIGRTCGFTFDKVSFANLLVQLKGKYKRIIIDTEPLDEDLSGFMAASSADGIYFICNNTNMRTRQPEHYYKKLKEFGANILGIIYNNVELKMVKKVQLQNRENHG